MTELLSIAIITVPERIKMARTLESVLKNGNIPIEPQLFVDVRYEGVWWNAKRAWSAAKGQYHMVIQDDCLPNFPTTFIENLLPIINILGNSRILTLFSFNEDRIHKSAITIQSGLLEINRITTAQALVISQSNVFKLLKWVDVNLPYDHVRESADDERIACWQLSNNIKALLPIPYMVAHLCDTKKSIVGTVITKKRSILPIDKGMPIPLIIYKTPYRLPRSARFLAGITKAKADDT